MYDSHGALSLVMDSGEVSRLGIFYRVIYRNNLKFKIKIPKRKKKKNLKIIGMKHKKLNLSIIKKNKR